MPGFFQEHLRPLAGSAGLHLLLLAIVAGAALHWTSSQPPVELAIQGYVVEGAPHDRPATASRRPERPPATPPLSEPAPAEPPETSTQERRAEQAAAAERAAKTAREQRAADEAAAERQRASAEAEAKREAAKAAAERKAAEQNAQREKAEQEAKRKAEAADAKRRAEAQAQAERDAEQRAEREAALQRRLAAEESAGAVVSAGVMDEYRRMLAQTIERNWIRPPSARPGLQCTLYVTQAPGGTVTDVRLGDCNGDAAVRESITNAVYRASPLPAPRDPRAFERRLEIVFKPTE